jgi:hypothetical protein
MMIVCLYRDALLGRWITLGLLSVENIRGAQAYSIPSPVELRYLSLQMHGSYGKETFCTMSSVQVNVLRSFSKAKHKLIMKYEQVFGKAAMGIIEQEIDQEAHLASYADVKAEILKSLDPNSVTAPTAVVVAHAEHIDSTESDALELAEAPSPYSNRFQWGRCVVCIDVCRAPGAMVAGTMAAEFARQQAQIITTKTVASGNATPAALNCSADGAEKNGLYEDAASSLSVKAIPASGSSIVATLSVAAAGGDALQMPASAAGAGEAGISKEIVPSAQAGAAVLRGDVDTPKIQVCATTHLCVRGLRILNTLQLDSNIIRKLWNKLRDLV